MVPFSDVLALASALLASALWVAYTYNLFVKPLSRHGLRWTIAVSAVLTVALIGVTAWTPQVPTAPTPLDFGRCTSNVTAEVPSQRYCPNHNDFFFLRVPWNTSCSNDNPAILSVLLPDVDNAQLKA